MRKQVQGTLIGRNKTFKLLESWISHCKVSCYTRNIPYFRSLRMPYFTDMGK